MPAWTVVAKMWRWWDLTAGAASLAAGDGRRQKIAYSVVGCPDECQGGFAVHWKYNVHIGW
jgi:hypothetical protein